MNIVETFFFAVLSIEIMPSDVLSKPLCLAEALVEIPTKSFDQSRGTEKVIMGG